MPRALFSTFSASTLLPQQFQLFQPIGGVRAMVFADDDLEFLLAPNLWRSWHAR